MALPASYRRGHHVRPGGRSYGPFTAAITQASAGPAHPTAAFTWDPPGGHAGPQAGTSRPGPPSSWGAVRCSPSWGAEGELRAGSLRRRGRALSVPCLSRRVRPGQRAMPRWPLRRTRRASGVPSVPCLSRRVGPSQRAMPRWPVRRTRQDRLIQRRPSGRDLPGGHAGLQVGTSRPGPPSSWGAVRCSPSWGGGG